MRFVAEGACSIKVFRSDNPTDFKKFTVNVSENALTDLTQRSAFSRNIVISTKILGDWMPYSSVVPYYRSYGANIQTDVIAGDVAKKWRMKLLVTLPADLPDVKCHRIFARYGISVSGELWAGDSSYSRSVPDCGAALPSNQFASCVQFEPSRTNGKSNGGIVDTTDSTKVLSYGYLGWAIDWSHPGMTAASTSGSTTTVPSFGPRVELQEMVPGSC